MSETPTMDLTQEQRLLALSWVRAICRTGEARAVRERACITRRELAECVGVTEDAVAKWELGLRSPSGAAAVAYACVLMALEDGA